MTTVGSRRRAHDPLPVGTQVEMLRSRSLAPESPLRLEAGDIVTIVRALERAYAVELMGVVAIVLRADVAPVGSVYQLNRRG